MKYEVSRLVDDFHLPSIVYMFVSCAIFVHVHIDRSVAPRMLLTSPSPPPQTLYTRAAICPFLNIILIVYAQANESPAT